jgi:hypothetical protein
VNAVLSVNKARNKNMQGIYRVRMQFSSGRVSEQSFSNPVAAKAYVAAANTLPGVVAEYLGPDVTHQSSKQSQEKQ